MSAAKIYLDTSFLFELFSKNAKDMEAILKKLSPSKFYTSCLTYDEFVWVARKRFSKDISLLAADFILSLEFLEFIDLNRGVIERSKLIMEEHGLKPRDSLHCATMISVGIAEVVTTDARDFQKIKGMRIIAPEVLLSS